MCLSACILTWPLVLPVLPQCLHCQMPSFFTTKSSTALILVQPTFLELFLISTVLVDRSATPTVSTLFQNFLLVLAAAAAAVAPVPTRTGADLVARVWSWEMPRAAWY